MDHGSALDENFVRPRQGRQPMTMMERSIKEQLLLLLSGVLAVAVTPFAIFRLANEQWAIAILEG
jgi:hypothetical protein